jgi:hypothetical protein
MTTLNFEGILKIREIPADWDEATFRYWWCDERSASGALIRRAAMSEAEKDRWTKWEGRNMLMNAGRNQILMFIGQLTAPGVFSQIFSVGTGTIYAVQPSDTTISGELARIAPASFSIVGNTVTVTSTFSTSQANGSWTNAGLWGGGSATTTLGTGTLFTHLLCSFSKTSSSAITCDYSASLT